MFVCLLGSGGGATSTARQSLLMGSHKINDLYKIRDIHIGELISGPWRRLPAPFMLTPLLLGNKIKWKRENLFFNLFVSNNCESSSPLAAR